jgi:hypothetical protein
MGAIANTSTRLSAAVANGGTVDVGYPSGQNQASLQTSTGGRVMIGEDGPYRQGVAGNVAMAFGASAITITNNTGSTWPAGAELRVSFGQIDINGSYNLTFPKQVQDKVASL